MPHWFSAACFGSIVSLFGVWLSHHNLKSWYSWQDETDIEETDRQHYRDRYRRRAQLAAMIVVTGVLLALGDIVVWRFGAFQSTVFWIGVLGLCFWITILAIGDMTSVHVHSQATFKRLQEKRRQIEDEINQYQRPHANRDETPNDDARG